MSSLNEHPFLTAVVIWLNRIPGATYPVLETAELTLLPTIVRLVKFFCEDENGLYEISSDDKNTGVVTENLRKHLLDHVTGFCTNMQNPEKIFQIYLKIKELNLERLVLFSDQQHVLVLAELLLRIGLYSSRQSNAGLTSYNWLFEEDRMAIDEYLSGDVAEENVLLRNELIVQSLQLKLEQKEAELKALEQHKKQQQLSDQELQNKLKMLYQQIEDFKTKNDLLKLENQSLHTKNNLLEVENTMLKTTSISREEHDKHVQMLLWEIDIHEQYMS